MAQLLITGGAGFIGSHTCLVLLQAGHDLTVLDDFSNSSPIALERVAMLAGVATTREAETGRLNVRQGDIRDQACLQQLFNQANSTGKPIEAVIHFAGLKAVGESVREPLRYWDVNLTGSRCLLAAMDAHNCRSLVFSSSCTLYGTPELIPISEDAAVQPVNPYGHSKAAVEQILHDLAESQPDQWRIACLRYFNPVGAHPSGEIGEDPLGTPNNLFPFVSQVAVGRRDHLKVFGGDWPTPDGTGVRDYIHVMDLAEGHRAALDHLLTEPAQLLTLNLGSGQGASVLEVVHAFESASGRKVPYELMARRNGDAAITVADPSLAFEILGWKTQRTLAEICRDGWAWQSANPAGYSSNE